MSIRVSAPLTVSEAVNDSRLSWKARGVLAYVIEFGADTATKLINAGPDGRGVVDSALAELESRGLIVRTPQERTAAGRFGASS